MITIAKVTPYVQGILKQSQQVNCSSSTSKKHEGQQQASKLISNL